MLPGPDFYLLILPVAFLYASVGHGGASGYLALMVLYGFAPDVMRPAALLLNIFVSLVAFLAYRKGGYFEKSLFVPLAAGSIPAAFAGGLITLPGHTYKLVLGCFLLLAAFRLLVPATRSEQPREPVHPALAVLAGGGIGFLSGSIGIGGGILLSPLLIFLRWADVRQTAAVSALFILVNSSAGLAGQLQPGILLPPGMPWMMVLALAGGMVGSHLGAFRFPSRTIRAVLGLVLILAGGKLLFF